MIRVGNFVAILQAKARLKAAHTLRRCS
jgi:hypothetical protein